MADLHFPEDLRYDLAHVWVRTIGTMGAEDDEAILGITDYAQHAWGCVGFAQMPAVGTVLRIGDSFGQLSCAIAGPCDITAPVSGEVVGVNDVLPEDPDVVNTDPYEGGWLVRVRMENPAELRDLLDAGSYMRAIREPLPNNVVEALGTVFHNAVDAMVLLDQHRRVLAMNPAAERLTGYHAKSVIGSSQCYKLFRCEAGGHTVHGIDCAGVAIRMDGRRGCITRITITRRDGTQVPVSVSYSPIPQPGGNGLFLLMSMREQEQEVH